MSDRHDARETGSAARSWTIKTAPTDAASAQPPADWRDAAAAAGEVRWRLVHEIGEGVELRATCEAPTLPAAVAYIYGELGHGLGQLLDRDDGTYERSLDGGAHWQTVQPCEDCGGFDSGPWCETGAGQGVQP